MTSNRRQRVPHPTSASMDQTVGVDYTVRYSLNEFQRGSFVMRFSSPPGKREIMSVLEQYGIVTSQVQDYSAVPIAGVKQARLESNDAIVVPSVLQAQQAQRARQLQTSPIESTPRKKRRGCSAIVLLLVVIGFTLPALNAERSYESGVSASDSYYAQDQNPFERFTFCLDRKNSLAESFESIWEEKAGFFEDRVSSSALHPANFSYMAGCINN